MPGGRAVDAPNEIAKGAFLEQGVDLEVRCPSGSMVEVLRTPAVRALPPDQRTMTRRAHRPSHFGHSCVRMAISWKAVFSLLGCREAQNTNVLLSRPEVRGVRIVGSHGLVDAISHAPLVLTPHEAARLVALAEQRLPPAAGSS